MLRCHKISIHALREEGDKSPSDYRLVRLAFLSTPSARRATLDNVDAHCDECISIHALREEGDTWTFITLMSPAISIHALREEGDSKNRDKSSIFKQIIQHSARI